MLPVNLTIDIGNTRSKLGLFDNDYLIQPFSFPNSDLAKELSNIGVNYPAIKRIIVASVIKLNSEYLIDFMKLYESIILDHTTPLPIVNSYTSLTTLGHDRIAAAVGANKLFPNSNVLVIDAGTSITYEFINVKNCYLGGAISPGIAMRYKSLHTFTDQLPLYGFQDEFNLIGNSTQECIISGVQIGVLAEVNGIIEQYKKRYTSLQVILTGGNVTFFEKHLKNSIFVAPHLVLEGLNEILKFNEKN